MNKQKDRLAFIEAEIERDRAVRRKPMVRY